MKLENNIHELIIPDEDITFKMFLFEGKDGNYFRDKHWHRSVEIFALFEGEIDFFLNDQRIHLTPGQFVLVNSNEIHSINALKPNLTVVMQIPITTFHRYYQDNMFIYFSHSRQEADVQIMGLIRQMYEIYQEKSFGYELAVQSIFYQLLYLMVIKYRESDISQEMMQHLKSRNKLSDMTEYIKVHYSQKITLEHLGSVFGYSPAYISKTFKKYAGYKFKEYLDSIRLEHAVQDLIQNQDTLDVIAARHGFPDRKALNRAFQDKYNTTPMQYRKSHEK